MFSSYQIEGDPGSWDVPIALSNLANAMRFPQIPMLFNAGAYEKYGAELESENKNLIRPKLKELTSKNIIMGSEIMGKWFPAVTRDVFISYSREDAKLAHTIAGFLKHELGLTSFIDSTVWGHCNDLLLDLDVTHCWNDSSRTSFNYGRRNFTTSLVHLILSTALTTMLNRCECVLFLSTPQSLQTHDHMESARSDPSTLQNFTSSPWIYHELSMVNILERKYPREKVITFEKWANDLDKIPVALPVVLDKFPILSIAKLIEWRNKKRLLQDQSVHSLDILYGLESPYVS